MSTMHTPPLDVLDDISSRFIINVPAEERCDVTRVMFQVELAHWFYLDWLCEERSELPKLGFKPFCKTLFKHVPFLRSNLPSFDLVLDDFRTYKASVPTYGAIIIDETQQYCLMVQGFWAKTSWGFPKGKVNHDEDPLICAIREVREEIGFDCTDYISTRYIEKIIRATTVRLYVVPGVSMDTVFQPMTRCEIKSIQWFKISDLPENRAEKNKQSNQFFMAIPFVKSLRDWVRTNKTRKNAAARRVQKATTDTSAVCTPSQTPSDMREIIDLRAFLLDAQRRCSVNGDDGDNIEIKRDITKDKSTSPFNFHTKWWTNVKLGVDWSSIWSEVGLVS